MYLCSDDDWTKYRLSGSIKDFGGKRISPCSVSRASFDGKDNLRATMSMCSLKDSSGDQKLLFSRFLSAALSWVTLA